MIAILVGAAVMISVLALVVYAMVFFDPKVVALSMADDKVPALRAKHQGGGACLRYPEAPSEEQLRLASEDFVRAGFRPGEITDLYQYFLNWEMEAELAHHEESALEEGRPLLSDQLGFIDRLALSLLVAIRDIDTTLLPRAEQAYSALSEEKRVALKDLWTWHAPVLAGGFGPFLDQLKWDASLAHLIRLADRVSEWRKREGRYPEDLFLMRLGSEETQDFWYGAIKYELTDDGARLISLGADGVEGGDGVNTDLRVVLQAGAPF